MIWLRLYNGELAQQLRALVTLSENLGSIHSTGTATLAHCVQIRIAARRYIHIMRQTSEQNSFLKIPFSDSCTNPTSKARFHTAWRKCRFLVTPISMFKDMSGNKEKTGCQVTRHLQSHQSTVGSLHCDMPKMGHRPQHPGHGHPNSIPYPVTQKLNVKVSRILSMMKGF